MFKLSRIVAGLAFFAAVALHACAAPTNVAPSTAFAASGPDWIYAHGVLYHRPHYALTRETQSKITPLIPYVPYQGGRVILAPKFYLIFWDYKKYGDAEKLEPLLQTYTQNMGGSGHNNIETQYYEKLGKKTKYITNPANQYGGSWDDESPIAKHPTDGDVAAESLRGVAHFGFDPNGVYVVATPHGHSEAGFGTIWCSYHSDTSYGKGLVPYANLPYMTDATGGIKCGANIIKPPSDESGKDEGMTIMAGHEYGESITDPYPFSGWTGSNGEIADPCQWHDIANDKFGTKSYAMQPMVSDATESCVQVYPSSSFATGREGSAIHSLQDPL
jgi:hypothetical protein